MTHFKRLYSVLGWRLMRCKKQHLITDKILPPPPFTDNKLTDTRLTLKEAERIGKELVELQAIYKTAIEAMKGAHVQLDSEMSRQQQTNWELEHQTKRSQAYTVQIDTVKKDIAKLKTHFPKIGEKRSLIYK